MNNGLLYDNFVDGFSSEQDIKEQQLICQHHFQPVCQSTARQQVKFKLPPAPEIIAKPYNLYPDTVTGWTPRIQLPSPVPIIFENQYLDQFIKYVYTSNNPNAPLCYLGPRYQNTYYAWFNKNFPFPYGHIKVPSDIKFTNRPFNGHNPAMNEPHQSKSMNLIQIQKQQISQRQKIRLSDNEKGQKNLINQNCLIFDSFFESGNLDCGIRVGENEYELFIRVDSNTKGHLQWFNFTVRNMKKMVKYKFHICNFQKDKSLYTRGMKPYIYSKKMQYFEKIGWEQGGEHVRYDRKILKSDQILKYNLLRTYRLSFDLTVAYDNDLVQIAYCIPYTYSQLNKFIQQISQKHESKGIVKISKLCTSLGGLQVPMLIVHQRTKFQGPQQKQRRQGKQGKQRKQGKEIKQNPQKSYQMPKKCIIISGRAHPGESNSSFMMHGFIQFICGDSRAAEYLRKYIIFKIIPMLNPDGVALGNYRTGLSGRDFNRQFRNPDRIIFPQVYAIRKLVGENKLIFKQQLLMFLDFHGHSIKKNVFMYGPEFPIIQRHYYQCRVFPKILSNFTQMFRYYSCIFKVSQFKETTARAVVLRKLNIPMTYTIEASNGSYYDHQKLKDIPFTLQDWKKMGCIVGQALQQYVKLIIVAQKSRLQKSLAKVKIKKDYRGHIYRTSLRKDSKQYYLSSESESPLTLPGIDDQKMKLLIEEIKSAEKNKTQSKMSDDQLSEGSSDQQGQGDDLSPNKVNFLYKIIKNKKMKALSNCRFLPEEHKEQRFSTNQDDKAIEADDSQSPQKSFINFQSTPSRRKSFIERNKQKINILIKNQLSREKPTAKIINFSFGSSCSARSNIKQMSNKFNILQTCVNSKIQEQSTHSLSNHLDCNEEAIFRKTFTSGVRQKQEHKIDHNLQKMFMIKNSRRVQDYKLRRIAIKHYKI